MIMSHKLLRGLILLVVASSISACSSLDPFSGKDAATKAPPRKENQPIKVGEPYKIAGKWYYPKVEKSYDESGMSSWYGRQFHRKKTANGEVFDMNKVTAAHRTLPLPSYVRVTNISNGRSIVVRVNDRGPFARNRIIDVSRRTAQLLGYEKKGVQHVRVQLLDKDGNITKPSKKQRRIAAEQKRVAENSPILTGNGGASVVLNIPNDNGFEAKAIKPGYYVQVGSFGKLTNAENARQIIETVGDVVVQRSIVDGQTVYRVKVGPIQNEKNAENILKKVKKKGFKRARVFTDAVG
jgi:rare lipoprotein A